MREIDTGWISRTPVTGGIKPVLCVDEGARDIGREGWGGNSADGWGGRTGD